MSKSSRTAAARKPAKPRPDFPLFPHATGRWAKKIRGRLVYFGKCADDPEGARALEKWLDQKDDLLAGRVPRAKQSPEGVTVADLCNRFCTSKKLLVDSGELAPRTFALYHSTCARLVKAFRRDRPITDLTAADFEALRAKFARKWGPQAVANEIQRVRSVFKYGYEASVVSQK